MLKANLEKLNSVNDAFLSQLIVVAISEIRREGIIINTTADETTGDDLYTIEDANLIVMYAAYLYRGRIGREGYDTAALYPQGMPYMLRYALNNRRFSQEMKNG